MVYIVIAAVVFGLDFFIKKQVDKNRSIGEQTPILKGKLILRKYYNNGAILDALEKWPWLVRSLCGIIVAVLCGIFAVLLHKKGNQGLKLGLAMVIGGGANNLYDRIFKGHVIDYFSFKSRFEKIQRVVFNISDLFIMLGTVLMLLFRKK